MKEGEKVVVDETLICTLSRYIENGTKAIVQTGHGSLVVSKERMQPLR